MSGDARLFNCARCHCQVVVCRVCDRGQVYCQGHCSQKARKASLQRAQRLYQSSRRGRLANAIRQKRFRQRQEEKVTHQGSASAKPDDLLPVEPRKISKSDSGVSFSAKTAIHCHFCLRQCGPFLRHHFLHSG